MKIISSNKDKKWFEVKPLTAFSHVDAYIKINKDKKDQKIFGFGGAFTDSATISYLSLNEEKRKEYIKMYFSKEGLNYSLGRYPIQSCDFSTQSYEYIKESGGIDSFDMSVDTNRIGFIKEVLRIKPDLWIAAVPWSPCAFMKDNNDQCHGGHLKKEYYSLWAEVIARTVQELDKNGIKISALSTQNEPLAVQTWESCIYSSKEEAEFLDKYLIPVVEKYGYKDMSYFVWDHNRDVMLQRTKEVVSYMENAQKVYGIAYHWYDRNAFDEVRKTHEVFPNLHILLTECCVELLCDDNSGVGSWENGLRYGVNIIKDLNNGSEGYIDWNLSLFSNGGPNHVGNFCEAPIMIDNGEIRYMPSFYVIGHFSKYLFKDDTRVESTSSNEDILVTSFLSKNNTTTSVVINLHNEDKVIKINNVVVSLTPKSVTTFYEGTDL